MEFGICILSVIPVRQEPSDQAEMTTQVLFGDLVVINNRQGDWVNIRIVYDNYEGWVDKKQILLLEKSEFNRLNNDNPLYATELIDIIEDSSSGKLFPILIGSVIRNISDSKFNYNSHNFIYEGQLYFPSSTINVDILLENALLFLNSPYLWGGKTPFGIDCSGFTQTVFKLSGIKLLRDASQQASQGETISLFGESRPGDLLFFDNEEGTIIHVGILIKSNEIIHASGKVRIDTVDHQGIYNNELKKYTHNLRLIKRII